MSAPTVPKVAQADDTRRNCADGVVSAKRKRPQSCDSCRARKIKCVAAPSSDLSSATDRRCVQCRSIDVKCTFDYVVKRPGPHPNSSRAAGKKRAARDAAAQSPNSGTQKRRSSFTTNSLFNAVVSPSTLLSTIPSSLDRGDNNWYKALSQHDFSPTSNAASALTRASSWNGSAFDTYLNQHMMAMTPHIPTDLSLTGSPHAHGALQSHSVLGTTVASSSTPSSLAVASPWAVSDPVQSSVFSRPPHSLYDFQHLDQLHPRTANPSDDPYSVTSLAGPQSSAGLGQIPLPSFSRAASPAPSLRSRHLPPKSRRRYHETPLTRGKNKAEAGFSLTERTVSPPRSLDEVAPREFFLSVMSLYFYYLWPLLPIVHRPSFSKDLLIRRDERDENFLAFVLSLTAYTLVQCPRTVLPESWLAYRKLQTRCHLASQRLQSRLYDPPLLLHVNTLYCDHIFLGSTGKTNAANAVLGEAVRVALMLGLHDETKVDTLTHPRHVGTTLVERELRKRMFWVLYGSSTTIAVLHNQPLYIHEVDTCVALPLPLDEDTLAVPSQDSTPPSLLCGFLAVTQLHQIMLEVLEAYRHDCRYPPEDIRVAQSRFHFLADASKRIRKVTGDMPLALRHPTFQHAPPIPVRRPGTAMPTLAAASQSAKVPSSAHIDFIQHGLSWPCSADDFAKQTASHSAHRSLHSPYAAGSSQAQMLSTPTASFSGNGMSSLDQVNLFRPSPPPSTTLIVSPMCTMHANIVITESLIRFLMAEYHALVTTRVRELLVRHPAFAPTPAFEVKDAEAGWEEATANVLRAFNSMPLEALASNGQSLIDKIVYIVSSLLKRTSSSAPSMGYQYMSSLLLTLTKLSQTRLDTDQDDTSDEEASSEDDDGDDDHDDRKDEDDSTGGGKDSDPNPASRSTERILEPRDRPNRPAHDRDDSRQSDPRSVPGQSQPHNAGRTRRAQGSFSDLSSCPSTCTSYASTPVPSTSPSSGSVSARLPKITLAHASSKTFASPTSIATSDIA